MMENLTVGKGYKYKKAQLEIMDYMGRYTIVMILYINGEIIRAQHVLTELIPVDIALEETYRSFIREILRKIKGGPIKARLFVYLKFH